MKSIYFKGRRKEYKIVEDLKKEGYDIAQRTAGSNSPIDIIAISKERKEIKLIQSKRKLKETMVFIDAKQKKILEEENAGLNGKFEVSFKVI